MKRIAIQGSIGSFHDIAAHLYFKKQEVELCCCKTFEQVFDTIREDNNIIGLVAIENTIAGSLLHNYELLRDSGLVVAGEQKLHINHCICCLPEEAMEDIKEVHSHPVALMQCRHYLSRHPLLKAVEANDTAGAAKDIAKNRHKGWAAICNSSAAKRYGLKVLENNIEDNKHNFTRFLVVCQPGKHATLVEGRIKNKSSLVFSLPHEEGSLSKVLAILSFYDINLTKIQSLPIIGREWEYLFYVDVTYNNVERYMQSIEAIAPLTKELRILGEYEEMKN